MGMFDLRPHMLELPYLHLLGVIMGQFVVF